MLLGMHEKKHPCSFFWGTNAFRVRTDRRVDGYDRVERATATDDELKQLVHGLSNSKDSKLFASYIFLVKHLGKYHVEAGETPLGDT